MRYLGRHTGYYAEDPDEAFDIDWAMDTLNDMWNSSFIEPWLNDRAPLKAEVTERV